jgi:uracil-DNA glycosylase
MRYEQTLWDLNYWSSDAWYVAHDKLRWMNAVCPAKKDIFKALETLDPTSVKVAIIGQDPYPALGMATGIAFSIPPWIKKTQWPPTFNNFIEEYRFDTGFPEPATGDLSPWVTRGVFLWNAIPTCSLGRPLSHRWAEWVPLTTEIISKLSELRIVFVLLGGVAREYSVCVKPPSVCLEYSHPSPRGSMNSKRPFKGSRLFTTVNAKLKELGKSPIDWRL